VSLRQATRAHGGEDGFEFIVDDDGEGIDVAHRDGVLARGARVDEKVAGQGIGLAVVRELVELSGGTLSLGESALGGAQVRIRI
jgi:signal transduction histidine kinase